MKNRQGPVLVLDADMVPSLAVIRSLHARGIDADIAHSEAVKEKPLTAFSNRYQRKLTYPDPLAQPEAFCHWLFDLLERTDYELVIPATERTLVALAHHPKLRDQPHRIAIPPLQALERVLSKDQTLDLAREVGVPFPGRRLVSSHGDLQELLDDVSFPVVLKPVSSITGKQANNVQLSVDYAFDREELQRKGNNLLEQCAFLVQQRVPGTGVGIELIAKHGEIHLAFQHERIHELPLSGGGSCYRKSVPVDPALLDASARLIRALNWHGVAMVEFKHDRASGRYWLMEINGRFWGSLPLAVAAGADFPYLLYLLHVTGDIPADMPAPKTGIRCRRLSADLAWYEQVLRGQGDPRLFQRPPGSVLLRQMLEMLLPSHRFDVQSLRDPQPGVVDIYRIASDQFRRVAEFVALRANKKRLSSKRERRRIGNRLRNAKHVLFVCHGNINRSPLAEMLAKQQLPDIGVEFRSAGFHPKEGRQADPTMREVARRHGVDLSTSRSSVLTGELIEWADEIVVMEIAQLQKLENCCPGSSHKAFLLGSLAPEDGNPEIPDPYGQPKAKYETCFNRVEKAIGSMQAILTSRIET